MQKIRKPKIKKYKPKKRLKLNIVKTNNFFIIISYATLSILIFIFIKINFSKITKIKDIPITKTKISKIIFETENHHIQDEIEKYTKSLIYETYSQNLINSFKKEIEKEYPYIKLSEKFNPITGNLTLTITQIPIIAKFANSDIYLLQNLSLTHKNPNPEKKYPLIALEPHRKIDNNILSTFVEISKINLLNTENTSITFLIEKNHPAIQYENKIKIIFPKNFKLDYPHKEKIIKVLNDAKNRLDKPFEIDARYIDNNKIIVTPIDY